MLRLRNLAVVLLVAGVVYAIAPKHRKTRFLGKAREFGRALVISLVIYWIIMIARTWFSQTWTAGSLFG